MKNIYFTPGPSQLYPGVRSLINKALDEDIGSISHRSPVFMDMVRETKINLSKFLDIPKSHKIFFLSSATECMERIIENCVKSDTLHFVNGAFSNLFYKTSLGLKKNAALKKADSGKSFEFSEVRIPGNTELVCLTHNETSTGVALDLNNFQQSFTGIKDTLYSLDIVSSAPYVKVNFDFFDLVFFSVQKGFGLPAGLAVLVVSPRAFSKAEKLNKNLKFLNTYHDFSNLGKYSLLNQTPETPNVLGIFLLNEVILKMNKKNLSKIRKETEIKANMLYEYFSDSKLLTQSVSKREDCSNTVCVADCANGSRGVISGLKKKGYIVGSGYKDQKDRQIRIANFPAHSISDVRKLINAMRVVERKLK